MNDYLLCDKQKTGCNGLFFMYITDFAFGAYLPHAFDI